jgi:hypothetical protein
MLKGTTVDANNAGFYRFLCVATLHDGSPDGPVLNSLTSDVAEIAVGCGVKNNNGEWLTFMCFNLGITAITPAGAGNNTLTISDQKTTHLFDAGYQNNTTTGIHTYITNEEQVWGDLYQWGRIGDGHQKRTSPIQPYGSMTTSEMVLGVTCPNTGGLTYDNQPHPWYQIKTASSWYGKFITGVADWDPYGNTNPINTGIADALWRTGRFVPNDPCAHVKADGSAIDPNEFWPAAPGANNNLVACRGQDTGWRVPTQDEWGSIYRTGTLQGNPISAIANSWVWYGGANATTAKVFGNNGYEVRPDGTTTTLFLPASGHRDTDGLLYYQGACGGYWGSNVTSTSAYSLTFGSGTVYPALSNRRAYGFAIRCLKN